MRSGALDQAPEFLSPNPAAKAAACAVVPQIKLLNSCPQIQWSLRKVTRPNEKTSAVSASLTSMESTKSVSAQRENIRLHPISSQSSAPSSREARTQHPLDISACSVSCISDAPDCHARFDTSAKLVELHRDSHCASSLKFGGREEVITTMSATV